ncbi:MAG: hypothetical protein ACTHMC_18155 [Pseudobacter sp.]|uniref:hypothetical protein n=1 Tax=Pseudobacter sp. TaxID=2045420 RepID=UPI003F8214FB
MKRSGACLLSAVLLLNAASGTAQEKFIHHKEKGVYHIGPAQIPAYYASSHGFTAAQVNTMRQNMHNFMELMHKTSCLNPPKGYEVGVWASVCGDGSCYNQKPMAGFTGLRIREYYSTKSNPTPRRADEGPGIHVWINDLRHGLGRHNLDKLGYQEPEVIDHIAGCPVLKGGYVVITKNQKPLYRYVTREEVHKILIKDAEDDVKKMTEIHGKGSAYQQWLKDKDATLKAIKEGLDVLAKTDPAGAKAKWEKTKADFDKMGEDMKKQEAGQIQENKKAVGAFEKRLQDLRDQLAALSPEERKKPYLNGNNLKVVQPNPEFWDPVRKPTDIQLVIIDLYFYHEKEEGLAHDLIREIRKTLNIAELAASVK